MCSPHPPCSTCPRATRLTRLVSPLPPQLPLTGSCIPFSGSMCTSFPDPRSRDCVRPRPRSRLSGAKGSADFAYIAADGSSLLPSRSTGSTSLGRRSLSGLWCIRLEARTTTPALTMSPITFQIFYFAGRYFLLFALIGMCVLTCARLLTICVQGVLTVCGATALSPRMLRRKYHLVRSRVGSSRG